MRCHEIHKPGRPHLDPIPPLAFDPFDKASREAWAKTTDPRRRQAAITKLLTRLYEDKDMPPEDAAEYEVFRVKDAAGFEAVRSFLEAELTRITHDLYDPGPSLVQADPLLTATSLMPIISPSPST